MAGDEERFEYYENPKFNRFLTMHLPSIEFQNKPHLQNPLERKGSFVKLYNSSFKSVVCARNSIKGKVKKLCSMFESTKSPTSVLDGSQPESKSSKLLGHVDDSSIQLVDTEDRIVVYFTSLRGIRRTCEDCCAVRMMLRGFRVIVNERDISMDLAYKKELQSVLGENNVNLPQVFIRGKYIGEADAIKQLHEVGELGKMIKGIPTRLPGSVCKGCGDVRFVPCLN